MIKCIGACRVEGGTKSRDGRGLRERKGERDREKKEVACCEGYCMEYRMKLRAAELHNVSCARGIRGSVLV